MGETFSTDKAINIYLTLDKLFYNEGDMVDGIIYLNVLTSRPYNMLSL
jgi:hypothetical protein